MGEKKKKKGAGTGREASFRLLSALFIINYVCIIVFLLPCFRKEIKKGHCFSNPLGLKAFTTLQHGASAVLPIGTEWNRIRGMQAALSPIMWLVALNI